MKCFLLALMVEVISPKINTNLPFGFENLSNQLILFIISNYHTKLNVYGRAGTTEKRVKPLCDIKFCLVK